MGATKEDERDPVGAKRLQEKEPVVGSIRGDPLEGPEL
jgi:hypothetical protein